MAFNSLDKSSTTSSILSQVELVSETGDPDLWSESLGGSDSELEMFEFSELEIVDELWLQ